MFNASAATFLGVTVNFSNNQVRGGFGGTGAGGGTVKGGNGGNGVVGGTGGNAVAGNGGNGGESGISEGGGIFDANTGNITINPRLGAKKGSAQAAATDLITGNQAFSSGAGTPVAAGNRFLGFGGTPHGESGLLTAGTSGTVDTLSVGVGGGIAIIGAATIDNTTITGNHADTNDNDVLGTFNS